MKKALIKDSGITNKNYIHCIQKGGQKNGQTHILAHRHAYRRSDRWTDGHIHMASVQQADRNI